MICAQTNHFVHLLCSSVYIIIPIACYQCMSSNEKRRLCSSVGFNNHLQNIHAAPTTDTRDNIARNPKWETSLARIATPSITDSAMLATDTSVVPIRFAFDDGITV